MDLAAGGLILLAGLPASILIGLAIKTTSRGPVFYGQDRVGKNGRVFRLVKFRTMKAAGDDAGPGVPGSRDPRVTAVGGILRRTRLDELPQALNIIKGEMSFIGPRPERADCVRRFERDIPFYALRFHIKPGLTGWAQVINPCGNTLEETKEKLEYDLYYLKNMGLLLDLRILLKTVRIVLMGKGR
jgi:lipopolysaccharide/colanic/teichoic acid biosynthesis glycosyltransferase